MSGRICKEQGCGRHVTGRGMCDMHYRRWKRANPGITMAGSTEQAVLDSMPGTIPALIQKTGLSRAAVLRALEVLNVAGPERQAYVYDWAAPAAKGKNWQPMYRQGARPNKRLTKEMREQNRKRLWHAWTAVHRPTLRQPDPPPRASWLDILPVAV